MISSIFREALYRPLLNALIAISNIIPGHDFGLAIIILTVLVRLVFFPLSIRAQRSQRALNNLNPKVQELKEKYKNDQAAQSQAIMNLYKDNNVSMVAGCLPILIQLPILIALYRAFLSGLNTSSLNLLYSFVHNPGTLNTMFLGLISVTAHNKVMTIITGVLQYLQIKMSSQATPTSGSNNQMAAINKQMMFIFPIMIVIIGWSLSAGLLLYWITTTLCSMLEQLYLRKTNK